MMRLNFDKEFYTPKVFVIWVIGVITVIVISVIYEKGKSDEFPTLLHSDSVDEKVIETSMSRSSVYVTLNSQRKIFIKASQNLEYKDSSNLSSLITLGDRLIKKPYSDTLILEHSGQKYLFIHGEAIGY